MSRVDCFVVFLLNTSRNVRIPSLEGDNLIEAERFHVRASNTTSAGQRDSRLNFNHVLNRTGELSAKRMGRCVVVKFAMRDHWGHLRELKWSLILFHLLKKLNCKCAPLSFALIGR